MRQIKKWYRADYEGEEVVSNMLYKTKKWDVTKEWIPNSVINNQISNQACVIGNGISRKDFNLRSVMNHYGGLLGRHKLQTYATNAYFRDAIATGLYPDFLVVTGDNSGIVDEITASTFCENNIVYADLKHIATHAGKFYSLPGDPGFNAGASATMLAAFDGHQKIYLLGFDNQDTEHFNYNIYSGTPGYQHQSGEQVQASSAFFEAAMKQVFDTYSEVDFVRVMPTKYHWMPASWKETSNLRQITFREFILEADL
jgi:hypothetical protein